MSLSINIPSLALNEILGKSDVAKVTNDTKVKAIDNESANESKDKGSNNESKENAQGKSSKALDLAKLLTSGNPVSIKSVETSTMGEKGNTEKNVKEIAIDTLGTKANEKEGKSSSKEGQLTEKAIVSLISALRGGILNSSQQGEEQNIINLNTPLAAAIRPAAKISFSCYISK